MNATAASSRFSPPQRPSMKAPEAQILTALWRQNGTLVGTAGNFWTAGESADVARFDMVASASTRWWTSSTDVAREAAHQEEEVQVPVDGGGFAINACDATLEVQVPMELNKALLEWHPTPKELQRGACMELTGYEDGPLGMGLDGSHCSDGLAASTRLYFVMEENFTQEPDPLYAGGMAMVYMPYLMDFMDCRTLWKRRSSAFSCSLRSSTSRCSALRGWNVFKME